MAGGYQCPGKRLAWKGGRDGTGRDEGYKWTLMDYCIGCDLWPWTSDRSRAISGISSISSSRTEPLYSTWGALDWSIDKLWNGQFIYAKLRCNIIRGTGIYYMIADLQIILFIQAILKGSLGTIERGVVPSMGVGVWMLIIITITGRLLHQQQLWSWTIDNVIITWEPVYIIQYT